MLDVLTYESILQSISIVGWGGGGFNGIQSKTIQNSNTEKEYKIMLFLNYSTHMYREETYK